MLTGIAILERELGMVEHRRHRVEAQLRRRLPPDERSALQEELAELDARKQATIGKLDELQADYEEHEGLRTAGRSWGFDVRG